MKVKFRMASDAIIRDFSGRYACPNLYCWREHSTGFYLDTFVCPNCEIELDWAWVKDDLRYKK